MSIFKELDGKDKVIILSFKNASQEEVTILMEQLREKLNLKKNETTIIFGNTKVEFYRFKNIPKLDTLIDAIYSLDGSG